MATAYLSGTVYRRELPILLVVHYEDGDWALLDGGIFDEKDAVAVHAEHIFNDHPELRAIADLPLGQAAERSAAGEEWKRYEWPDDPDGPSAG